MDDPRDLRPQAAAWRRQAQHHGGEVAQALELAATILEEQAVGIETARSPAQLEEKRNRTPA